MYEIGSYFCHQLASRTFFDGKMPLCSRCTGIYIGMVIGFICYLLFCRFKTFDKISLVLVAITGLVPILLDGGSQYLGFRLSNNLLRYSTGILFGAFILIFILSFSIYTLKSYSILSDKILFVVLAIMFLCGYLSYTFIVSGYSLFISIFSVLSIIGLFLSIISGYLFIISSTWILLSYFYRRCYLEKK